MTRLRWTNPPRESDPARTQSDPHVLARDPLGSPEKSPRADLFARCLKAKLQHENACHELSEISRQLNSLLSFEAKSENSDSRRIARGLLPESQAAKARRGVQIERAKERLFKAELEVTSARELHDELADLWRKAQPI